MDSIRFGIVGLGFAGSVIMAPAMYSHPRSGIHAACDLNKKVRERFGKKYSIPVFETIDEMIDSGGVDAVYISTPHHVHREGVIKAAKAGLHILVEKPMTLSVDDAKEMVEVVETSGVKLVVGASRSHDPIVRTMRELVQDRAVGHLSMVNCFNYTNFLYRPRRPEDLDTQKGGGIIYNQLPHQIDSIKTITSKEIISVKAFTGRLDKSRPTEGNCMVLLTLEDGIAATAIYSGYDHFDSDEFHYWIGENGREKSPNYGGARKVLEEYDGKEEDLRIQRYGFGGPIYKSVQAADPADRKQPHFGIMIVTGSHADLRGSSDGVSVYGNNGKCEVSARPGRGSYCQGDAIDELLDGINGVKPIVRDARWGKNTVEVCNKILESSNTGKEVYL